MSAFCHEDSIQPFNSGEVRQCDNHKQMRVSAGSLISKGFFGGILPSAISTQ